MMMDPCTLYAHRVVTGEEVAGPWVRAAARRHMRDMRDAHMRGLWFDIKAARKIWDFFEESLKLSEGQFDGKPFRLHPCQYFILGSLFGWQRKNEIGQTVRRFRRAYIEMVKCNGKAGCIKTPVATPDGWVMLGDLRPGDVVFDETGKPCNVTAVSGHMHDRPCYRVRFNDGSEIVADADHLWKTAALRTGLKRGPKAASAPRKGGYAIRTTAEIARTLTVGPSMSRHPQAKWNHRVDIAGVLELPDADLPISPYAFGAWLGDGNTDAPLLTLDYDDWQLIENIESEGVLCREMTPHRQSTAKVALGGPREWRTKLRNLGVLGKKFIPTLYLRASAGQRLALLQGLMDTDGTVAKNGQCELTLCSSGLADDAVELIASLGLKPTRNVSEAKLNGRVVGHRHRIQFWAYRDRPVFRLTRKAERLRAVPSTRSISQGRMIVACEPVPSVPVQCISVDSPSRMFLWGRTMIPTHNSPLVGGIGLFGMLNDNEPGAQIYSAGATRDQADILFQDAVKMAKQSPDCWELITPSGNAAILNLAAHDYPQNHAFFRPLSREKSRTGSGPRPHMALLDELHEHPDGGLLEMLERGFKFRRQPIMIMITNSGSDRKSVCWEEHQHAISVAVGDVEDDTLFSYVCALDEEDKPLEDESCWKKANPLLGVILTYEYLRGVVKQATDLPSKQNNILRLHFCVWTDAATAWLPRKKLEACEDPHMTLAEFEGKRCHAGLDLSATKDMTAKALLFDDGWKEVPVRDPKTKAIIPDRFARRPCYALFVTAYTPEETLAERAKADKTNYPLWVRQGHLVATPGPVIRLDMVAADLVEDSQRFDLVGVAYDQYLIRTFQKELDELGASHIVMHNHPQGISRREGSDLFMPQSVDTFENLVLEERIRIQVSPVLRSAIAGATFWQSAAGLKRFEKSKATARIDACVAAAMAIGLATLGVEDSTSVYDLLGETRSDRAAQYEAAIASAREIDYEALNDPKHPNHKLMLARLRRLEEADEDDERGWQRAS